MTLKRLLFRFFDVKDFFTDCGDTIRVSGDRIGVLKNRIGSIASIEASEALERNRGSVSIFALVIAMCAY